MSQSNKLQIANSGIEQLLFEVKKQIATVSDAEKQLTDLSIAITNFTLQILQAVQGNEDIPLVNQTLADALIQVKDFVGQRPTQVKEELNRLMSKLDAYEQALLILKEVDSIPDVKEPTAKPLASEAQPQKKQKKQKTPPRKISERPERLKNIRQAETQNEDPKILQEDI